MPNYERTSRPSLPSISFDTHFANVPNLQEVRFNPERCADLLTHRRIGMRANDLARVHIYVRPDYKVAYTRAERKILRAENPEDYDDAGSTEMLSTDGPFGRRGDVLMTLVYRSGYGVNKLLCHEAIHAKAMLQQNTIQKWRDSLTSSYLPRMYDRHEAAEEAEADKAMKSLALRGLRKNVIEVITAK